MPGPQMQGALGTLLPAAAVSIAIQNSSPHHRREFIQGRTAAGTAGVLLGTAGDRQELCLETYLEIPQTRLASRGSHLLERMYLAIRDFPSPLSMHRRIQTCLRLA